MLNFSKNKTLHTFLICLFIVYAANHRAMADSSFDFSSARVLVSGQMTAVDQAAIEMLVDEVKKRTQIELPVIESWPGDEMPLIVMGTFDSWRDDQSFTQYGLEASNSKAEAYQVVVQNESGAPRLFILGNDSRGLLYGTGYVLRKSYLSAGNFGLPAHITIDTHPYMALRGHQLGYRPKTNSYCGFDVPMWEQYFRDLVVFGSNAIELLPPYTDDVSTSEMFTLPPLQMMQEMVKLSDKYDLDVWIWYPLMHGDYTVQSNVSKSLEENREVFNSLKRIDAVFVPGGDPGHTQPAVLFDYLEKKSAILHEVHPEAELWVSPQGFDADWMDEFIGLLKDEPSWLTGLVHGPQVSMDANRFRELVPKKYPIRLYPDITHTYDAQYPVTDWDFAFAATQNREPINPRPLDQALIFRSYKPDDFYGFLTYSEGVNDDVNKMIWSGLGWDPDADVMEILQDYSRYFIGPDYENDFAKALLGLEMNWRGPLISNSQVMVNHAVFETMDKEANPFVRRNWRFQMALYRSYYDAYVKSRLLYETQLEYEAMDILRNAPELGSILAMQLAEDKLEKAVYEKVASDRKQRLNELAEALFHSVSMQLSVGKYFAAGVRRGANLDLVEYPLNNRIWLKAQFMRISQLNRENERLAEIDKIVNWTNPGPGGYYTDLGDLNNQHPLVYENEFHKDPQVLTHPFVGFTIGGMGMSWRVSWARYMHTLYDQPMSMHYSGLDPASQYQVKVTYVRDLYSGRQQIGLTANGLQVHPMIDKPAIVEPLVFDVPHEATKNGELTLTWASESGMGGTGRGCQIGEVWLIRKK